MICTSAIFSLSAILRLGHWLQAAVLLNQLTDFIPQLLMVHTQKKTHTQRDCLVKAFISSLFQLQKHVFSEYHYLPKLHQHYIEYSCPYRDKPTCHCSRSQVPFQHFIDWAVEKEGDGLLRKEMLKSAGQFLPLFS